MAELEDVRLYGVDHAIALPCLQDLRLLNLINLSSENFPISSPSLERLAVCYCPKLTNFTIQKEVNGQIQLKDVKVDDCDKLKSIFSPCLAQSLLHLEKLEISNCANLKQVFAFDKEMAELEAVPLSNLRSLKLHSLLTLESVRKEPTHHENQMPSLSNLTCLELDSLPELRCIWGRSIHLVNLQHLKTMRIWSCSKLEYLFSPTLAQALMHLEELWIKDSDSLEHLITQGENGDEIFSNKDRCLLCWPKLKSLEIASCKSLRYVFPITLAQGLPELESVQIIDCPQLMHVFNMAEEEDNHDIVLPKLQFLRLEDLENWRSFCPSNYSVMLPSFKGLEDCNNGRQPQLMTNSQDQQGFTLQSQLKNVRLHGVEFSYDAKNLTLKGVMRQKNLVPNVDPKGLNELTFLALKEGKGLKCLIDTTNVSTKALFNLVELVIEKMTGLEMLCNGRIPKGFLQKLEKLEAKNCMDMVSLSTTPQNLKEVKVINCSQLQEVFQIDELPHDTEENQGLLLSNLTLMELHSLPKLQWIWKGSTHFVSLQSLKFVEISYCNRLKYLFSPSLAQSLMLLEQLKIDNCHGLQHIIRELECDDGIESEAYPHPPLLPKLETLGISHCPGLKNVFQVPLGQVLPRLKSFWITNSPQLQQVFNVTKEENGVDSAVVLPCLQDLRLENLKNLNFFCLETFLIALPSLEKLEVLNCPRLTNFTIQREVDQQTQLKYLLPALGRTSKELPNHASLQSLKDVRIQKCDRMKSIFSSFRLLHLEKFEISQCNKIEQVFTFAQEMDEQEITTLSSLTCLELKSLPKLSCIWSGPTFNLRNLKTMKIQKCNKLVCLFLPVLAQTLTHLEKLDIQNCYSLEHFIREAENSDEVVSGEDRNLLWPNLKSLEIAKCKSLKYVFLVTFARGLPNLESLGITDCPQLMHVFHTVNKMDGHEAKEMDGDEAKEMDGDDGDEAKEMDGDEAKEMDSHVIELPQLKDLTLKNLEKLRSFCPKNYFVKFSFLKDRLLQWK